MRSSGIDCTQSPFGKAGLPVFIALFAAGMLFGILPSNWFVWTLWAILIPYMLVYSPDFTVYDDGIEVRFPWRTAFNSWGDVYKVRKTAINTRIYARNLTWFNVIMGFGTPWIVAFGIRRDNYDEAIDRIKQNIGERFTEYKY